MNNKTKKLDDFINNLEPVNETKDKDGLITDLNGFLDQFIEDSLNEFKITDYKDRLFAKEMIAHGFFQGLGLSEVGDSDTYEDVCKDCQCCGNNSDDNE